MNRYILNSGELSHGLRYVLSEELITETAFINRVYKFDNNNRKIEVDVITIHENYVQFLWSIGYSILQIVRDISHNGIKEFDTDDCSKAIQVFSVGMSLLTGYDINRMYSLPNPEKYSHDVKERVEQANAVLVYSVLFVLLHEVGHHFYGHTDGKALHTGKKDNELLADEYALNVMMSLEEEVKSTANVGVVIAMLSLLLIDGNDGGASHPDPMMRLDRLLQGMKLQESSNVWTYAFVSCFLWCIDFGLRWNRNMCSPQLKSNIPLMLNYQNIRDYINELPKPPDSNRSLWYVR